MPREEWRSRGPRGLARGWGARGRKLPDAVAASRTRRSRPSARSGHERSRGTRSRTAQGDAVATGSAHPRGHLTGSANGIPSTQASPGRHRRDPGSLPGVLCSPCRGRPQEGPAAEIAHARPSAPAAAASLTPWLETWVSSALLAIHATEPCFSFLLYPERGVGARPLRQGSSPKGGNGRAGSSGAEEPGPKGDANLDLRSARSHRLGQPLLPRSDTRACIMTHQP